MDIADRVIRLFTERDAAKAAEMALELNQLNGDRQQREQGIIEEIHKKVADSAELRDAYCQVIDGEGWHRGIIGICATRVVERYHRPALVFSCEDGEAHGSGRSIPTFHLLEALESCPELFTRFGGHAHAVGCSLPTERLPELRARLDAFARQRLTPADFVPVMEYDADLPLPNIDTKLWETLQKLEPYGAGNPLPVFVSRQAKLVQPPRILKEKHLKLRVVPDDSDGRWQKAHEVVAWRMAERSVQEALALGDILDIAFTLDYNDHPDFGGLQLTLVDFARSEKAATAPAS
jgi:single-stranded-DNA-specific exonuclease